MPKLLHPHCLSLAPQICLNSLSIIPPFSGASSLFFLIAQISSSARNFGHFSGSTGSTLHLTPTTNHLLKDRVRTHSRAICESDSNQQTSHSMAIRQTVVHQSEMIDNPLSNKSEAEILIDVEKFCNEHSLGDRLDLFKKGALLAANPKVFEDREEFFEEDKVLLRQEVTHKWRQPWAMYYTAFIGSMAAIVQGMDQSVVNGALLYYNKEFGIDKKPGIQGIVNSAPYLCCFILACWLTAPLNHYFGRRGAILISCLVAAAASIWEGFTFSWVQLFLARFVLGIGIGAKSTTAPIYTAECSPAPIRGAMVMMWQMWTAFGIMLGLVVGIVFMPPRVHTHLAWRLMLGSAAVPAILVCAMIYFAPESPHWYIKKNRYPDAFKAICRLRRSELIAARDMYYMSNLIEAERELQKGKNLLKELITVPRNRRAMVACAIVMIMQQFCGINVIAYYSSTIFIEAGLGVANAMYASLGTGIVNWLFAIPAFYTIDTFGRRSLLLLTFPLMSISLLVTGLAFFIPAFRASGGYNQVRIGVIASGIYFFEAFYSPGEGPIPFTYAAEAFPLQVRELGMAFATACTWGFNCLLSLTFPKMLETFKPQGVFGYYAGWNLIGFLAVFLILPETKSLTLEELDKVFSVSHKKHMKYQLSVLKYWMHRLIGNNPEPIPSLYSISGKDLGV